MTRTRYRFYCSRQTFDQFEANLKPHWRFVDGTFIDTQGRPHMLIPMQMDVGDWPVLIGTDDVPSEDDDAPRHD